jgi:hypothetical protein
MEQLGGPDLPETGNQVTHILRGRPRQFNSVQNAFQVVAVPVETSQVQAGGLGREQCFGNGSVPDAQGGNLAAIAIVLAFSERNQP